MTSSKKIRRLLSKGMDVKTAIEIGDAAALAILLAENPGGPDRLIEWGQSCEIRTHPLHYVSDMLFDGTLERCKGVPLIDELLSAGSDCNYRAANGETPLIGAASLGAEDVGLRLLDAGARPDLLGAFQETALHWAAHLGLLRLSIRLIGEHADVNLKDARYRSSPLGWAIHGRLKQPPSDHANHCEIARLLVAAGAAVDPDWLSDKQIRADPMMLSILHGDDPKTLLTEGDPSRRVAPNG